MKINYIIAFFTFTILNKDADIFLYLLPVIIGNEFIYIVTLFAKFDEKYEYSMIMVNLWQLLRVERRIFASKKLQNLDERFCWRQCIDEIHKYNILLRSDTTVTFDALLALQKFWTAIIERFYLIFLLGK